MKYLAFALLLSVMAACSSAVQGPRQIPERSRGVYAFDVMLPDPSIRDRLKGTYQVLADTVLLDLDRLSRDRPGVPADYAVKLTLQVKYP